MKAAKSFDYGDGEKTHHFDTGDEVPSKIAKDLDDSFILEKVAKSDPNSLSREQLLVMAGINSPASDDEDKEYTEEEFREALSSNFRTKGELIDWANEAYGVEMDAGKTRAELEDEIVSFQADGDDEEE